MHWHLERHLDRPDFWFCSNQTQTPWEFMIHVYSNHSLRSKKEPRTTPCKGPFKILKTFKIGQSDNVMGSECFGLIIIILSKLTTQWPILFIYDFPAWVNTIYREINGHFRRFRSFRSFYMMRMTYPNHGIDRMTYTNPSGSPAERSWRFVQIC